MNEMSEQLHRQRQQFELLMGKVESLQKDKNEESEETGRLAKKVDEMTIGETKWLNANNKSQKESEKDQMEGKKQSYKGRIVNLEIGDTINKTATAGHYDDDCESNEYLLSSSSTAVQVKMLQDFDGKLLNGILSYEQKADIYN
ncbi:Hypp5391 [Branchiostoma lanceolatum]|uniref:Hypp5391 protein n=1 Tax=Branchiostoma lanceolatum TaxID=7740 RepID=A0A8K0AHI9_BRALA|nr:Hypp5391 [Branchiostoma lanceolatum]